MRTKEQILKAITTGNYKIRLESECHHSYQWKIINDNLVYDEDTTDACWVGNTLYIGREMIVSCDSENGLQIHNNNISESDIPEDVINTLCDYDDYNEDCETEMQRSLISYLKRCKAKLYITDYNYIINLPGSKKRKEQSWKKVTAAVWVDWYLDRESQRELVIYNK